MSVECDCEYSPVHGHAEGCPRDPKNRALPLEGEQGELAKDQGGSVMDRETLLAAARLCREQAERSCGLWRASSSAYHSGASDAAILCERAILALAEQQPAEENCKQLLGAALLRLQELGDTTFKFPTAPAPHHHSRTEQIDRNLTPENQARIEDTFQGLVSQHFDCHYNGEPSKCDKDCAQLGYCKRRTSEPAPAREPSAVEEVRKFVTFTNWQSDSTVPYWLARHHAEERDRLREQLQGGVVVPRETVAAAARKLRLVASIYTGDKESLRLADELRTAAKEK